MAAPARTVSGNLRYISCTLKKSPEPSHTQGLIDASSAIMMKHGGTVEEVRAVDHPIATGVYPDMREHGWEVWVCCTDRGHLIRVDVRRRWKDVTMPKAFGAAARTGDNCRLDRHRQLHYELRA